MASSSSSQVPPKKYDVFISFRGSDTRHGFLSHLQKGLRQNHIDVYVDERLEKGGEISSALVEAIQGSTISLVIFSKDYASSKWCLEELVKIMECKETNRHIVMPVFYNIDPSYVRHQKGSYADAFAKHEERFKDNMDIPQIWRFTLTKVANLSGYHYSSNSQNESQLVDEICKDVLKILDDIYPVEPKCLVGFDKNLACIESLLNIESDEIHSLGIWGMGGIGKTTIAHAVSDKFSSKFQSCCFLENVREESKQINGLSCLLQKLLSELLAPENLHMNDAVTARSIMASKRRLRWRKVLVVLDDVDTSEQLEYLIGEQLCLGPGSRIIVTTRDKHVLISHGILLIHEMEALKFTESMKLFSLNAFNQCHPKIGYEDLSIRAVGLANGIPLALKVLGSYFHSRNMETWKSALQKLQKYPNVQIQNVLKVSYEGLDDAEKEMLLDIAFFFKGESKDDVIRVLDAFGFFAMVGIENLLNKALITVSYNYIQMHDLIQEMCKQIVREESSKHPERRSRLRDDEEIYHVLKNNKGTDAIEGIILNVSQSSRDLHLNADTFTKMTNLRFLKFYYNVYGSRSCNYVNLPASLDSFPDKLGYFHWDGYPWKSLPSISCAEKLVVLAMENSQVRKLWEGVQGFVNLKRLSLRGSRLLEELPDFSMAQNLEEVNLVNCESLSNLHPSILYLHTLVYLYLDGCKNLRSLQSEVHLKSLKQLRVDECYRLEEFSLSSEEMTCLYLEKTGIGRFHSAIRRLCKLTVLHLNGSKLRNLAANELCCLRSLKDFRISSYKNVIHKEELRIIFDGLHSLEKLHLKECTNLSDLPDNISALTSLHELVLGGSNIENLPASIKHLPNLKEICLINCRRLLSIPEFPPYITRLNADNCVSLEIVPPLKTFKREDDKEESYSFTFQNCLKLHDHSFMMEFSHVSLKRGAYNNYDPFICYPGSSVPKWFVQGLTTETYNSIELTPSFDDLKGFFCCAVVSHFIQSVMDVPSSLDCHVDLEDCKYATGWSIEMDPMKLNSDHVFLWYQRGEHIYEAVKRRRNILGTTCNPKLSFQFSLPYKSPISDERAKKTSDSLIKACGVFPIYASEYDEFLQQMEFKAKTKRLGDIGSPIQLPPANLLRTSPMLSDCIPIKCCDGPSSFMSQVYCKQRRNKALLTISGADESIKEAELASDKADEVARAEWKYMMRCVQLRQRKKLFLGKEERS